MNCIKSFLLILCCYSIIASAQSIPQLEKSVANKMKASATDLINAYKDKLNKIGSKTNDNSKKQVLIQETYQLFDSKDVRVFNDIDASGRKSQDPKISTYLEDIYVLYGKEGLSVNFENITFSDLFVSRNFDFFFYKITFESVVNGKTNTGEKLEARKMQDMFVQFKFKNQTISPEPVIYEIFKFPVSTEKFIKVQIVEDGKATQAFSFGKTRDILEKNNADILTESAKKWVANYYSNLNILGSKQFDMMKKSVLSQEIIEQFESDAVLVYNDIDPTFEKAADIDITTYLGDIVTLYGKEGVSFQHKEVSVSDLLISKNNKFLFLIATCERVINGTDNSARKISNTMKINFIVQYNIADSIIKRKPIFTAITDQSLASHNFIKLKLSDGTAPVESRLVLEPSDEEVRAILNKTKENENENKKKEEELNQKINQNKEEAARAEAEKAEQEKQKKILMWEQKNIDKYFDGWDKKTLIKFYPLRMLMGSLLFSVEQGLKTKGKNISVEQSLGLYPGMKPAFFSYDELENPIWVSKTGDKNSTFFGYTARTELRFYFKPNSLYGKYISVQAYIDRMTWSSLEPYFFSYTDTVYNGTHYNAITINSDYDGTRTHIGGIITFGAQRKLFRSKYTIDFYFGIGVRQQTITRKFKNQKVIGRTGDLFSPDIPLTDYPFTNPPPIFDAGGTKQIDITKSTKIYPEFRMAFKFGYRLGNKILE